VARFFGWMAAKRCFRADERLRAITGGLKCRTPNGLRG
jgi:hypothetical protein